jgi:hypothetical protein
VTDEVLPVAGELMSIGTVRANLRWIEDEAAELDTFLA